MYLYVKYVEGNEKEIIHDSRIPKLVTPIKKYQMQIVFWSKDENTSWQDLQKSNRLLLVKGEMKRNQTGLYKALVLEFDEDEDNLIEKIEHPPKRIRAPASKVVDNFQIAADIIANATEKGKKKGKVMGKEKLRNEAQRRNLQIQGANDLQSEQGKKSDLSFSLSDEEVEEDKTKSDEQVMKENEYDKEIAKTSSAINEFKELQVFESSSAKNELNISADIGQKILDQLQDLQTKIDCKKKLNFDSEFLFQNEIPAEKLNENGKILICDKEVEVNTWRTICKVQHGDSMFVKELAVVLWGRDTLARSSLTGMPCNRRKHDDDYVYRHDIHKLTPAKIEKCQDLLRCRIKSVEINESEIEQRVRRVKFFLREKCSSERKTWLKNLAASQNDEN